jgi:plasmid stability protein
MLFCKQIAAMATLTIRNVPDELHARLKERARRNRRSLNQEVIAELSDDGADSESERLQQSKERMAKVIADIEEWRKGVTRFATAEEIDAAIEEGRA